MVAIMLNRQPTMTPPRLPQLLDAFDKLTQPPSLLVSGLPINPGYRNERDAFVRLNASQSNAAMISPSL